MRELCSDYTGNFGGQNPLSIQKWYVVNQEMIPDGTYGPYKLDGVPTSCSDMSISPIAKLPSPWNPEYDHSVLEAIANSHPGEPAISLPNFLYELKDLPGMLKDLARKIGKKHPKAPPKSLADDYLAYTFGWAPFVSDIMDIAGVTEWTASRARMLENIRKQGFTSRKKQRGTYESKWTENNAMYDNRAFPDTRGTALNSVTSQAWVSSRWKYTNKLPLGSSLSSERSRLVPAALGLGLSFSTMWDAMPWSWMVDYFTDISSIAKIHQNRAGFKFDSAVEMEYAVVHRTIYPAKSQWAKVPVTQVYEKKSRYPANATLADAGLNFLSPRQILTLGALSVSRILR
jgi:hypothetical protein